MHQSYARQAALEQKMKVLKHAPETFSPEHFAGLVDDIMKMHQAAFSGIFEQLAWAPNSEPLFRSWSQDPVIGQVLKMHGMHSPKGN